MKWGARQVAIFLLGSLAMVAHAGQYANPSAPSGQDTQQNERPTLGPKNGPGLASSPDTSTTTDLRKLMRVRTLYIENIDNSLSDKLVEALGKWGRFRLVTKAKDADATLRGSCLESRRLKHVHSEVFISDRGGASLWQDTIYRPFNPPGLDQAVSDTAALVAAHLERTFQAAVRQ
jgi:hypothetical protein